MIMNCEMMAWPRHLNATVVLNLLQLAFNYLVKNFGGTHENNIKKMVFHAKT